MRKEILLSLLLTLPLVACNDRGSQSVESMTDNSAGITTNSGLNTTATAAEDVGDTSTEGSATNGVTGNGAAVATTPNNDAGPTAHQGSLETSDSPSLGQQTSSLGMPRLAVNDVANALPTASNPTAANNSNVSTPITDTNTTALPVTAVATEPSAVATAPVANQVLQNEQTAMAGHLDQAQQQASIALQPSTQSATIPSAPNAATASTQSTPAASESSTSSSTVAAPAPDQYGF